MVYIICLIIGAIIGFTCAAMCHVAKEADEKTYIVTSNNLEKCYIKPITEIEQYNFKETLKIIINGDITLYRRLYQKSDNIYYLGRIRECEFLLKIVEGKAMK